MSLRSLSVTGVPCRPRTACARRLHPLALIIALGAALSAGSPILAGTILTVDVVSDGIPTSGNCDATPADCSLRRAIELATTGDEIQFDAAVFAGQVTIQLVEELFVDQGIRITGTGTDRLTVRGSGSDRVFRINQLGTFAMTGLAITNGFAGTSAGTQHGGGVLVEAGGAAMDSVAFIGNSVDHSAGGGGNVAVIGTGSLRVTNSLFASGVARGGSVGGGVYLGDTTSALFVVNGVFTGNESFDEGAAVANAGGSAYLTQSTLTQNTAQGQGGAIYSSGGVTTVEFSTLAYNDSTFSLSNAREIYVEAGKVTLDHTILAAPTFSARGLPPATICADDSVAPNDGFESYGRNLANRPCFLTHPTDLAQQPVGLGFLILEPTTAFYPLLPTSPAIDAGEANCSRVNYSLDFDQRRLPRRLDADGDGIGQCDIGAIEVQAIFVDGFEGGNTNRWM